MRPSPMRCGKCGSREWNAIWRFGRILFHCAHCDNIVERAPR